MQSSIDISKDRSLLWLMAIACGLCAGANYYCQPLIRSIQQYYQVPESQVALSSHICTSILCTRFIIYCPCRRYCQ